jgi:adhesin transport system outer membrane protein
MNLKTVVILLAALGAPSVLAQEEAKAPAEPISGFLGELLKTDRRIQSSKSDLDKETLNAKAKMGDWYPNLKLTSWTGRERIENPTTAATSLNAREADLTFTQLLWDFGKTSAAVRQADLKVEKKTTTLDAVRQNVIVEAAAAYVNLHRAHEVRDYAIRSEQNLMRQLQLERDKLASGAGKASDVQQVQATLSGASARRARIDLALQQAGNRFFSEFGRNPTAAAALVRPALPVDVLPASQEEAVRSAMEGSLTLSNARKDLSIEREAVREERANSLLPKLEFIHDYKRKSNIAGTAGIKTENFSKVQLTWDFDLGFSGRHKVEAAEFGVNKASSDLTDAERNVTLQVRNAWQSLDIAKRAKTYLDEQVSAAGQFLELARKEHLAGKRPLLDVLNGETILMNAQADAASAEADILLSAYNLLLVMGRLDEAAVSRLPK